MAIYNKSKSDYNAPDTSQFEVVMLADQAGVISNHSQNSMFGEQLMAQRTPLIELNSYQGLSKIRNIVDITGSASSNTVPTTGEIHLRTGTTANSKICVTSAERGRYMAGYAAQIGCAGRLPETNLVAGQQVLWGGFTDDFGFFFGIDDQGLFVATRKAGVDKRIYQTDWNIDKLDGSGFSGFNVDLSAGVIFQINYTWYGYGVIQFGVVGSDSATGQQTFLPVHFEQPVGGTSTNNPNLPVTVEVQNGASGIDTELFIGGRQYSVLGKYNPSYRYTSDVRAAVQANSTPTPLISFRRKAGVEYQGISVKLSEMEMFSLNADCVFEVYVGGTLTGASWGAPSNQDPNETVTQSDTSATTFSGGIKVWTELVPQTTSGSGRAVGSKADAQVDYDVLHNLGVGNTVTLCARSISGANATVTALMRIKEEW